MPRIKQTKSIRKEFTFIKGKNLRTSDLTPDPHSAIDFRNCRITKTLSLTNRVGSKIVGPDGPYCGLTTHTYPDSITGATQEIMLGIDQNLWKRVDQTFTITYSGSNSSAVVNFGLNPNTFTYQLVIVDGGVTVLTYDVGTGLENSPITVTQMQTAINAVTHWAATFTGASTTPAAFLPLVISADCSVSPHTAIFHYNEWSQINSTVTNPFGTSFSMRGNDNYEPPSFVHMYGDTFIATGYEFLHKYDGQTVYRAGLPKAVTPTIGGVAAGALTGAYRWVTTYEQIDNRGRDFTGTNSDPTADQTLSAQSENLTITNIVAGSGFNTNGAHFAANTAVAPSSGAVTLTVQAGHTMKAGDTAFFFNRHASVNKNKAYPVASVTGTTIVLTTTDTVTTLNNDPASNNLKIQLWRNKAGGNLYFLVHEFVNDSLTATQAFLDNTADAALGAEFDIPIVNPDLLTVKPKYLCEHQSLLIATGDIANPNTVYFADILSPESFPSDSNNFDIASTFRGSIAGCGSDQENLIIGFDNSIFYCSGTLSTGQFRVEKVAEGSIGVASHASIKFISFQEEAVAATGLQQGLIFLSRFGFKFIVNGTQIVDIGANVNPIFTDPVYNASQVLSLKRAVSVNYEKEQLYMCFIPAESGSGTGKYANDFSTVQVFDYFHNAWGDDTGINMGGGVTVYDDNLHWVSKRLDPALTVAGNLFASHTTNTENDYADHSAGIDFKVGSQWDDGGDPDTYKLFQRVRIFNLLRDILGASYTLNFQTEKNFVKDVPDTQSVFEFGSATTSGYGYFPWGVAPWGTFQSLERTTKLKSSKARSMRFVFYTSVPQQKIGITGWSYQADQLYGLEMRR